MTATIELPARPLPESGPPIASPRPVTYGWSPRIVLIASALLAAVLLVLNAMVAAGTAGWIPAGVRTVLVAAGMCLLPGMPVMVALRIPGRALFVSLGVAASLSVNMLVAQAGLLAGWWHPLRDQTILLAVSLGLSVLAWPTIAKARRTGTIGWRRDRWTRRRGLSLAGVAAAVLLLIAAAANLDVLDAASLGVFTVAGPFYYIGLVVIAAVIVAALRAPRVDHLVLAATTAVVVAYNTMLVGLATGYTSVPTAFVHRGFVTIIVEAGRMPPKVDARFSWAGFFSGAAHLQVTADLPDVTTVMLWAPLVFGVLLSFGVYAIAVAVTGRVRLAWGAVLLYHAVNWYQQDYFAPQATAMLGYAAIVATLLWQLRAAPLPRRDGPWWRVAAAAPRRIPGRVPGFGPIRTLAVGAVLLVIITANVISHQMTPILIIIALALFTLTGTTRYRTLWLAAGLIFAAWFSYGAYDYWLGHLPSLLQEIGAIGNSVDKGVSQRIMGDPLYQRMQYLRIGSSGLFALVAAAGWLFSRGKRTRWVAGFLCAAPGMLVVLQSYGGEMIIRAFLLAAPTMAPFAAIAITSAGAWLARRPAVARLRGTAGRRLTAAVLIAAVALIGLVETINRGLNTAFEATTRGEVTITADFINELPAHMSIMTFSHAPHTIGVRRTLDPTGPRFGYIDSYPCLNDVSTCALDRQPDYIYITNQGVNMIALQYGLDRDTLSADIAAILDSPDYLVNTETDSVLIIRRIGSPRLELPSAQAESTERRLR